MTLQTSGALSFTDIKTELSTTGDLSIGTVLMRALAQKPSGSISLSDFYGRSCHLKTITAGQNALTTARGWADQAFGVNNEAFGSTTGPASLSPGHTYEGIYDIVAQHFNIEIVYVTPVSNAFYAAHMQSTNTAFLTSTAAVSGEGSGRARWTWSNGQQAGFTVGQVSNIRILF